MEKQNIDSTDPKKSTIAPSDSTNKSKLDKSIKPVSNFKKNKFYKHIDVFFSDEFISSVL